MKLHYEYIDQRYSLDNLFQTYIDYVCITCNDVKRKFKLFTTLKQSIIRYMGYELVAIKYLLNNLIDESQIINDQIIAHLFKYYLLKDQKYIPVIIVYKKNLFV